MPKHPAFIVGTYRISKPVVYKDFQFLFNEKNMENPYTPVRLIQQKSAARKSGGAFLLKN